MPTRLIVAYSLIALLILISVGIAWWKIHHSPRRTETRLRARRRAAQRPYEEI